MDLISILATVILLTTIGTLVVAVAAYGAFKLRDKRKPTKRDPTTLNANPSEPIFLTRYMPQKSAALGSSTLPPPSMTLPPNANMSRSPQMARSL